MRLAAKLLLAMGLMLGISTQASAISISLVPDNASPVASDTITLSITVSLDLGDALTLADPAIDFTGAKFISGTESAFDVINGVLMSPIGAPGADIGLLTNSRVGGWESQTLAAGGAPGAASWVIGTATFHLTDNVASFSLDQSIGTNGGTIVGGANFANVTGAVTWGNLDVPEPTTAGLAGLSLLGFAFAARRRS